MSTATAMPSKCGDSRETAYGQSYGLRRQTDYVGSSFTYSKDKNIEEDRDALFAEFTPLLRRLVRQYAGEDFELREDLRSEMYCRFSQLYDEWDPTRGIPRRPYLVRKLSAAAYTYARQNWRRDRRETSLELGEEYGDQGPSEDPTDSWDHSLALDQILEALPAGITRLPERQRKVLLWRYIDERPFEDIAKDLNIQVSTARSILRHSLNNLRKWIKDKDLAWE